MMGLGGGLSTGHKHRPSRSISMQVFWLHENSYGKSTINMETHSNKAEPCCHVRQKPESAGLPSSSPVLRAKAMGIVAPMVIEVMSHSWKYTLATVKEAI